MSSPLNPNIPPKPGFFDQVVNYVTKGEQIGGKPVESDASSLAKQAAMSLFIAAPCKGKNLSVGEKVLNGVFLCGVCTVLSPALAGYAIKMNSLKNAAKAKMDLYHDNLNKEHKAIETFHKNLAKSIAGKATAEALMKYYTPTESAENLNINELDKLNDEIKKHQKNIEFCESRRPDTSSYIADKLEIDPAQRALKNFQIENDALNGALKKAEDDFLKRQPEGLSDEARQLVYENVISSLKERRDSASSDILKELNGNIATYNKELEKNNSPEGEEKSQYTPNQLNHWLEKGTQAKDEVQKIIFKNITDDLSKSEEHINAKLKEIGEVENEYETHSAISILEMPVDELDLHIDKGNRLEMRLQKLNEALGELKSAHQVVKSKLDEMDAKITRQYDEQKLRDLEDAEGRFGDQITVNQTILLTIQRVIHDIEAVELRDAEEVEHTDAEALEHTDAEALELRDIEDLRKNLIKELKGTKEINAIYRKNEIIEKFLELLKGLDKDEVKIKIIDQVESLKYQIDKLAEQQLSLRLQKLNIMKKLNPVEIKYNEGDDLNLIIENAKSEIDLWQTEYLNNLNNPIADNEIVLKNKSFEILSIQIKDRLSALNNFFKEQIPITKNEHDREILNLEYEKFLDLYPQYDQFREVMNEYDAGVKEIESELKQIEDQEKAAEAERANLIKNTKVNLASQMRKLTNLHQLKEKALKDIEQEKINNDKLVNAIFGAARNPNITRSAGALVFLRKKENEKTESDNNIIRLNAELVDLNEAITAANKEILETRSKIDQLNEDPEVTRLKNASKSFEEHTQDIDNLLKQKREKDQANKEEI